MIKVIIEFFVIYVVLSLWFSTGCAITKLSVRVDEVQVEVEVRP